MLWPMCPVFPRLRKGLADFAVVQSYLSTAAKWGISKLGALRDLFNGQARVPPGLEPAIKRGSPVLSHNAGDAC